MIVGWELQSQVGRPCGIEAEVFTFPFKAPVLSYPALAAKPLSTRWAHCREVPELLLYWARWTRAAKAYFGSRGGPGRDL